VLIAAALVLLALVTATVGYLWLRSYMPIRLAGTSGPGPSLLEVKVVRDPDQLGAMSLGC
jgi:hypothetical protein